jgi:predicted dehydrogenase
VLASWAGPLGAQVVVDNEMLIYGTHGSVQMAERWAKQEGVESWTAYRFATETGYEEPQFQDWASMDSHFLDVIQGLAQPVANVYDGLNATRLVIAGEESAHTGQPVAVDLVQ